MRSAILFAGQLETDFCFPGIISGGAGTKTVLVLKDQDHYVELTADNMAVLSKTVGAKNHLTIFRTSRGAGHHWRKCKCMFPFLYNDQWYSDCTVVDSPDNPWCSIQTKYEH